jgi:hypothetical protein
MDVTPAGHVHVVVPGVVKVMVVAHAEPAPSARIASGTASAEAMEEWERNREDLLVFIGFWRLWEFWMLDNLRMLPARSD